MTLKDRIALLKGGYTKKEIEELAKLELEANVEAPEIEEAEKVDNHEEANNEQVNSFMDTINKLVNEVRELKTSIHQENINNTEIENRKDEAEQILASIINPLRGGEGDK